MNNHWLTNKKGIRSCCCDQWLLLLIINHQIVIDLICNNYFYIVLHRKSLESFNTTFQTYYPIICIFLVYFRLSSYENNLSTGAE